MSTSGTVAQTQIDVADLLDKLIRRCGGKAEQLTPEIIKILKENLFLFLSQIPNRDLCLWCVDREMYGLYDGQTEYQLAAGTVNVLEALYRTMTRLTAETITSSAGGTTANLVDGDIDTLCTQVSGGGSFIFDFGADQSPTVNIIGFLSGSTVDVDLLIQVSNDGITWRDVATLADVSLVDHEWQWFKMEPAFSGRYLKIDETGTSILSLRELYLAQNYRDISMSAMNMDDYSQLPFKQFESSSQSLQYWFNRQITPSMVLWPSPPSTFDVMYLFTQRQIQDVGTLQNTIEVPQRWLPAIIDNVALQSILELPKEVADLARMPMLAEVAALSLRLAEGEEVDRGPFTITPNISCYTR